ncbi:antibiotic biosynthesis monooxygenase family protein [Schlesneria paludicola]|uniref:antibiotic biosynthesis monooxygenase family protein n=1 Tax=Schlesneria paludicola TaxID=360056 RepID=UPI00029AD8F2|nr:antibiotic biosynthesis monooxygenase [Schlesneria paludicola]
MTVHAQQAVATITPPYYAVIFSSVRTDVDDSGYAEMAQRMEQLAREQPGFLKIESVRDENGLGITISYWKTLEAISAWRQHAEHRVAQERGKSTWYQSFELQICRVERAATFHRPD